MGDGEDSLCSQVLQPYVKTMGIPGLLLSIASSPEEMGAPAVLLFVWLHLRKKNPLLSMTFIDASLPTALFPEVLGISYTDDS